MSAPSFVSAVEAVREAAEAAGIQDLGRSAAAWKAFLLRYLPHQDFANFAEEAMIPWRVKVYEATRRGQAIPGLEELDRWLLLLAALWDTVPYSGERGPSMVEQLRREIDFGTDPVLHPAFLAAVRRLTEAAVAADEPALIRAPSEWFEMVQRHMPDATIGAFLDEALSGLFDAPPAVVTVADERRLSEAELNRWFGLIVDVWNNTPQLDRGGRTPLEMMADKPSGTRTRARRGPKPRRR